MYVLRSTSTTFGYVAALDLATTGVSVIFKKVFFLSLVWVQLGWRLFPESHRLPLSVFRRRQSQRVSL